MPLGELAAHPDVIAALGGPEAAAAVAAGHEKPPAELYLLAGIRGGKSLLAAAMGVRVSQTCDLSHLRPGEIPRVSLVSTTTDLAGVVYGHLKGTVEARPALRSLLVGEPTATSVTLRHPTGHPVELKVVAGARAGASLVARWSAGVVFDEFPRMVGADDGVINFDDARKAVLGRLLPGAQLFGIGSPWAPFGPAFRIVGDHWGKPTPDLVVIRGTGPQMNPSHWTPARCEELRRRDPIAHKTDVLGEFADPEAAMFGADELLDVTRQLPLELPPTNGHYYAAAIDPATRNDAFTLVVTTRIHCDKFGNKQAIVLARHWKPQPLEPLSPDKVLEEIAGILRPYGVHRVTTDQWAADALRDLGIRHGLYIADDTLTASNKVEMFESLKALVADKRVELAPVPELLDDLRRVRKVVTQTGIKIELPHAAGRHCDLAMAAAMALAQPCAPPDPKEEIPDGWSKLELESLERSQQLARQLTRDDDGDSYESAEEFDYND